VKELLLPVDIAAANLVRNEMSKHNVVQLSLAFWNVSPDVMWLVARQVTPKTVQLHVML
jgi:hypothetical protein